MIDSATFDSKSSDTDLLASFGLASLLVIVGVLATAFVLSREAPPADLALPALPELSWVQEAAVAADAESWLDLADSAFAAGRVTAPVADNALYYYDQAMQANGGDERARSGMQRVLSYVIGEAETAVYEGDWGSAREAAQKVLAVAPEHPDALSVLARTDRFERVEVLQRLAVNQLATERLLEPSGDNALHSYRLILQLEPSNDAANVGIKTIAQRLLAKSQAAAYDGNFEASAEFLDQARRVAPDLAGLDSAMKMNSEFARLSQERVAAEAAEATPPPAPVAPPAELPAAPASERIFSVSELNLVRNPPPTFPRRAAAAERDGWVELNFRVDERGLVFDSEVVRSSHPVFESAALSALRKWRFKPYLEDGKPVSVRSGVRFSFRQ